MYALFFADKLWPLMYIVYADHRFLTLTNSESLPEHSVYSFIPWPPRRPLIPLYGHLVRHDPLHNTKCIFFILWISNCHANHDINDYVIIKVN